MPLSLPSALELKTIRALAEFSGRRVLEIGAGDGRLAWPFAAQARLWVALDPDAEELRLAAEAMRAESPAPTVQLAIGDGRTLPFPNEYFDLAFFSWSLC